MTEGQHQRQHVRVAVSMPAKLSVLLPELTFRPVEQDCEVLDLSERGAMINVQLTPENYSMMLQKTRYCRLEFTPEFGLPPRVTGRAVWLQPQGNDINRTYRIGLFFEDCPPETVSQLRNYLQSISLKKP